MPISMSRRRSASSRRCAARYGLDAEKHALGLDRKWRPVFEKGRAQTVIVQISPF
jgi:hypothetical protein